MITVLFPPLPLILMPNSNFVPSHEYSFLDDLSSSFDPDQTAWPDPSPFLRVTHIFYLHIEAQHASKRSALWSIAAMDIDIDMDILAYFPIRIWNEFQFQNKNWLVWWPALLRQVEKEDVIDSFIQEVCFGLTGMNLSSVAGLSGQV
jgi:hypothetical protein